jgi:hypothetical protein
MGAMGTMNSVLLDELQAFAKRRSTAGFSGDADLASRAITRIAELEQAVGDYERLGNGQSAPDQRDAHLERRRRQVVEGHVDRGALPGCALTVPVGPADRRTAGGEHRPGRQLAAPTPPGMPASRVGGRRPPRPGHGVGRKGQELGPDDRRPPPLRRSHRLGGAVKGDGMKAVIAVIDRWETESLALVPTFAADSTTARLDMAERIRDVAAHMRDRATDEGAELDRAAAAGVPVARAFKIKGSGKHIPILEALARTPIMSSFKWDKATYFEMRFIE